MLGRRSQNLDLIPLDPDLERTLRRTHRAPVEMEDDLRNANQEENIEYQDARAENEEQVRAWNMDFTTSLLKLFAPVATSSHSCIMLPPTNATHFDLKPHAIQLLPSFYSLDYENPYGHVKNFKDMCATFMFHNFLKESVHLRLFPFSLQDRVRAWLDSNMARFITSWESLLSKFYNKFFPMSKVNLSQKEISYFTQEKDEKFSESWEHCNELLIKCPPHGYEK
jgi:hypothetical protein